MLKTYQSGMFSILIPNFVPKFTKFAHNDQGINRKN